MINTEKLHALLKEKGITQADMSREVGVTQAMMSYILNGFKTPSVSVLQRMAARLGVTMEELLIG